MTGLPNEWTEYPVGPSDRLLVGRTYPDGVDVQIRVTELPSGRFELVLSAEHRCSGPTAARLGEFATFDEAVTAMIAVCAESDRDQLS